MLQVITPEIVNPIEMGDNPVTWPGLPPTDQFTKPNPTRSLQISTAFCVFACQKTPNLNSAQQYGMIVVLYRQLLECINDPQTLPEAVAPLTLHEALDAGCFDAVLITTYRLWRRCLPYERLHPVANVPQIPEEGMVIPSWVKLVVLTVIASKLEEDNCLEARPIADAFQIPFEVYKQLEWSLIEHMGFGLYGDDAECDESTKELLDLEKPSTW
jgi:hypothetical protein